MNNQTSPLTTRQDEVLVLVAKGLSNEEIAEKLAITPGTAKVHVSCVYERLNLKDAPENVRRVRTLIYALTHGNLKWYEWIDEMEGKSAMWYEK